MSWIEILGYAASGAVFVTFWMRTLISLRLVAIVGNTLYLAYGIHNDIGNIMLLHGALLPLNLLRLYQALSLRHRLREMAQADFDARSLVSFMTEVRMSAGNFLFKKGEAAEAIYFLTEGRCRIEEIGVQVDAGQLLGEIAMFTPDKTRTQSVLCETDCTFMRMTEEKSLQLYAENPEFGMYATKMIVARLLENSYREKSII